MVRDSMATGVSTVHVAATAAAVATERLSERRFPKTECCAAIRSPPVLSAPLPNAVA
ncbi:Uncharacterised protein [Mycobacteroides abscessus subsp. massiliense]|nr:Uncharacterised protein [Mycobacteroides abscessus subsp. massiliense]